MICSCTILIVVNFNYRPALWGTTQMQCYTYVSRVRKPHVNIKFDTHIVALSGAAEHICMSIVL